jgi:hypothetical protein
MIVAAVALAVDLELTCADPVASRQQVGRARLSELEQAEDAAWGTLREALARCGGVADTCDRARAEFGAEVARARASIEERYRRILEEFEARCRLPLT